MEIPAAVVRCPEMTAAALRVASVAWGVVPIEIADHSRPRRKIPNPRPSCWLSKAGLAEATGLSRPQVERALSLLARHGFVRRVQVDYFRWETLLLVLPAPRQYTADTTPSTPGLDPLPHQDSTPLCAETRPPSAPGLDQDQESDQNQHQERSSPLPPCQTAGVEDLLGILHEWIPENIRPPRHHAALREAASILERQAVEDRERAVRAVLDDQRGWVGVDQADAAAKVVRWRASAVSDAIERERAEARAAAQRAAEAAASAEAEQAEFVAEQNDRQDRVAAAQRRARAARTAGDLDGELEALAVVAALGRPMTQRDALCRLDALRQQQQGPASTEGPGEPAAAVPVHEGAAEGPKTFLERYSARRGTDRGWALPEPDEIGADVIPLRTPIEHDDDAELCESAEPEPEPADIFAAVEPADIDDPSEPMSEESWAGPGAVDDLEPPPLVRAGAGVSMPQAAGGAR